MWFQVKTLTGKTIDLDLDPQQTIGELKNLLQLREGRVYYSSHNNYE